MGSSQSRVWRRSDSSGLEQRSRDVVAGVAEPRTDPRRCSSQPLIALEGPFLVPGRSKNASTSKAPCLRVRPRRRIPTSAAGTPLATESFTDCIMDLPFCLSGSRYAPTMRWSIPHVASNPTCSSIANTTESRGCRLSVSRFAPVCRVRRTLYSGSPARLRWPPGSSHHGRPRRLPRKRHAHAGYTLKREESQTDTIMTKTLNPPNLGCSDADTSDALF